MYRVAILLKNGERISDNFNSKDEADTWLLELMEKEDIKKAIIVNKENINEKYVENF
jgi:hypothetical protein